MSQRAPGSPGPRQSGVLQATTLSFLISPCFYAAGGSNSIQKRGYFLPFFRPDFLDFLLFPNSRGGGSGAVSPNPTVEDGPPSSS